MMSVEHGVGHEWPHLYLVIGCGPPWEGHGLSKDVKAVSEGRIAEGHPSTAAGATSLSLRAVGTAHILVYHRNIYFPGLRQLYCTI